MSAKQLADAELLLSGCTADLDQFDKFPRGDNSYFDAEVEGVRPTGSVLRTGQAQFGEPFMPVFEGRRIAPKAISWYWR